MPGRSAVRRTAGASQGWSASSSARSSHRTRSCAYQAGVTLARRRRAAGRALAGPDALCVRLLPACLGRGGAAGTAAGAAQAARTAVCAPPDSTAQSRAPAKREAPRDGRSCHPDCTNRPRAVEQLAAAAGFVAHVAVRRHRQRQDRGLPAAIDGRARGRPQAQVLVLVPEINLTPQLEARCARAFAGRRLVSLHSGLTAGAARGAMAGGARGSGATSCSARGSRCLRRCRGWR